MNPNEDGKYIGDVVQPAKITNPKEITDDWIDNNKDKKFFIAGYPGDRDLNNMWHAEGNLFGFVGKDPYDFIGNIPGAPGNSGSPVFNEKNEVVGILYSGWDAGNNMFGLMFKDKLYDFVISNT